MKRRVMMILLGFWSTSCTPHLMGPWRIVTTAPNAPSQTTYWNFDGDRAVMSCGAPEQRLVVAPSRLADFALSYADGKSSWHARVTKRDDRNAPIAFQSVIDPGTHLEGTRLASVLCPAAPSQSSSGASVPSAVLLAQPSAPSAAVRPTQCSIDPPAKFEPTGFDHLEASSDSVLGGGTFDYGTPLPSTCFDTRGVATDAGCEGTPVQGYTFCGVSAAVSPTADEVTLLDRAMLVDDTNIFPGNFLVGSEFSSGRITPFVASRAPGRFHIDRLALPSGVSSSFTSAVSDADLRDAVATIRQSATAASADFRERISSFSSKRDFLYKNGLTFNYSGFSLEAQIDPSGSERKNYAALVLNQGFYRVVFDPPSDMYANFSTQDATFGGKCFQDPRNQLGKGKPLLYVANVLYGRQAILVARSSLSKERLEYLLHVAYAGNGVSIAGTFDGWDEREVQESEFNFVIRGGATEQVTAIQNGNSLEETVNNISRALHAPAFVNFDPAKYYPPIAYTLSYLPTQATATIAYNITGWQRSCRGVAGGGSEYQLVVNDVDDDVAVFRLEKDGTWGDWNRNRLYTHDGPCNPGQCTWGLPDELVNGAPFSLTVGNRGCLKSNATFEILRAGVSVYGPATFTWGAFNHCGYQVDIRLHIGPDGKPVEDAWKRIP